MREVHIIEYNLIDTLNRIRKRGHVGVFKNKKDFTPTMKQKIIKAHPDHRVLFEHHSEIQPFVPTQLQ
jgi:hypothetical protein